MQAAPFHPREAEWIASLRACGVLDMPPDPSLERIALLAADVCRCPISHVTFVDGERHWVRGGVGAGTDARAILRDVIAAGSTLQRMTRDILDVSRAEVRGIEVHATRFAPRAELERAARAMATRAAMTGHVVTAAFDLAESEIDSDPELLRRVVENLSENALKYAPPGTTVRLSVETTAGGPLRITVADEGPGIPEDQRQRVFEPGVRLVGGEVGEGWGFGLRFCKLAVDALGGTIEVGASAPRGSVFVVEVPSRARDLDRH